MFFWEHTTDGLDKILGDRKGARQQYCRAHLCPSQCDSVGVTLRVPLVVKTLAVIHVQVFAAHHKRNMKRLQFHGARASAATAVSTAMFLRKNRKVVGRAKSVAVYTPPITRPAVLKSPSPKCFLCNPHPPFFLAKVLGQNVSTRCSGTSLGSFLVETLWHSPPQGGFTPTWSRCLTCVSRQELLCLFLSIPTGIGPLFGGC